jgi:hypothetical protein
MKVLVLMVAVLSGACELFGTVTVAKNYLRAASVAGRIAADLGAERQRDEELAKDLLENMNWQRDPYAERRYREDYRTRVETLAAPLGRDWLTTAGLWAFGVGAVLGIADVALGLYLH